MKGMAAIGLGLILSLLGNGRAAAGDPVQLTLTGDWTIQATLPAGDSRPAQVAEFTVPSPPLLVVTSEKHDALPVYQPKSPGYARGARLRGVRNAELTTPFLLEPESFTLRAGPNDTDAVFEQGKDFDIDLNWGTFGRLEGGSIPPQQPVYASYRHRLQRLDSLVLTADGKIRYQAGQPATGLVVPPTLEEPEQRLGNIWIPGRITKLTEDHLFPILETECPTQTMTPSIAEQRIPKALAKLRSGEPIRILAWGDSVTESTYLPDRDQNSWQVQFVDRLQKRFPQAKIELITEGWGGRTVQAFLNVPPGEPHNYAEKVLGAKPDLIVSEFVNDAYLKPEGVETLYSKVLKDFEGIGAEWVILTPHYVRPDWMGLTRERDIDADPRPYVAGLKQFAEKHPVALADGARRYGHLWRQGIPYTTLMGNAINHPNAQGMTLFAEALMEIFPSE